VKALLFDIEGLRPYSKRKSDKCLQSLFIICLIVSTTFLPLLRAPPLAPPEVAKYLKDGESIISIEDLTFTDTPEFNLTVFKLSSGAVLLFSKKYNCVVLGDEWIKVPNGEHLALQYYTAYYFSKEKQVDFLLSWDYPWYAGVELFNDYATKRLIKIGVISLSFGIISLILTGGLTLPTLVVFLISYGTSLALTLDTFIDQNLGLKLSNVPQAYLALVILRPKASDDMKRIYETLDKLEKLDKEGANLLKRIAKISDIWSNIELVYEYSKVSAQWGAASILLFAAKAGVLESTINAVGEEKVTKFTTFFITGDKTSAREFLEALKQWESAVDQSKRLEAIKSIENILSESMLETIVNLAISAGLKYLTRYMSLEIDKTKDNLMGFFGLHSLLLGDLHNCLNSFGSKLSLNTIAPIADNILMYYQYKQIYYNLRDELFDGLEKYDLGDIFDTGILSFFMCVPCVAGDVTHRETILAKVQEVWRERVSREKRKAKDVAKEALSILSEASDAFERFKRDMASRRKAPGPTSGMDIVLAMDVSGSMGETFRGKRKIDAAIQAGSDFVRLMGPYDQIALVNFSSQANIVSDLTVDKQRVINALSKLTPGGYTALGDGLWLALDILEKRGEIKPAAVILLTDGKHNPPPDVPSRTPRESTERARKMGIPVYTLGFGEKADIDEETLREIASSTGGSYYYAPSPDDLRKLYMQLSGAISGHMVADILTGTLAQGEVKEVPVNVAPGEGYFSIKVAYTGSLLELSAISPSGKVLDPSSYNVIYYREKGVEHLTVYTPEPGQWKILVKAVEAPPGGVEYSATLLKPGLTAEVEPHLVKVAPNSESQVKISVKTLRDLPYIRIELPPSLSAYASVQPREYTSVKAGSSYEFVVRFTAPPSDVSDAILVQSLDSFVWINVYIKVVNTISIALASAQTEIREGKPFTVQVWLLDENNTAIRRAQVIANVDGMVLQALETSDGLYTANVSQLKLGINVIKIEAQKPGYRGATVTHTVRVLLLGDVNKDDRVDYRDLAILVAVYGEVNHPADFNEDGVLDYKDIAILMSNYGRKL